MSEKSYAPPYPFVVIVWDDAASNAETWVPPSEITGPEQVISAGWLIKETPTYVAIASSVSNEAVENETVGNTMTIPKGMIVTRRVVKLAAARSKTRK